MQLLQTVVLQQKPVGTRESARKLGISASSAYRLLRTLAELGYLEQDQITSKYRPGLELYRLAATLVGSSLISEVARRPMEELAEETGEAIYLCLRHGRKRVVLNTREGWRQLRYTLPLGDAAPLYVGSSGLAILAWMPERDIEAVIDGDLQSHGPRTITEPEQLRQTLKEIRSQGYAITQGHTRDDGVGVSAPIFKAHSEVTGSLLLTVPTSRKRAHGPLTSVGESVREKADRISIRLGGSPTS
jgi:DNA-binding IclR family transcriptional regulator